MQKSITIFFICIFALGNSQVANYVNNGGFEDLYDCQLPNPIAKAKYWKNIDSIECGGICSSCTGFMTSPLNGFTYQLPKSGFSYALATFFCVPPSCQVDANRCYHRNRLKKKLNQGKIYCVKFYVNISNNSTYGMDGFGAYFGELELDTISKGQNPLSYLTPQVQNQSNNIITDTLNWTAITGTFVATGTEKYMVIGNFKSDATTNKLLINATNSPAVFTDVCIDDISCIEVDLPAYAGPDRSIAPGDSVYIGRENDFAIDSGCTWYQLPNLTTPVKNKTSGFWAKPVTTTTYVVKQILECSAEKWDTVVVHMDLTGLVRSSLVENGLSLFPNPATDYLELKISNVELFKEYNSFNIYNHLGQVLREEEFNFKENVFRIRTEDLPDGVYSIQLKHVSTTLDVTLTLNKRFVISR